MSELKTVPIDDSSNKGYISNDGTIRDKYLTKVKPESDDNGRFVLIAGKRRYVKDLLDEHFNVVKSKSNAPAAVSGGSISGKGRPEKPEINEEIINDTDESESDSEIEMIADLFREDESLTYAQVIDAMLDKGHKVTRNQVSEGKSLAGLK